MSNLGPDEAEPLGRRERNKRRVRERLYSSAIELFIQKGYEQTSVDEIAEAADVARGTFFNHFQRKEDLITAWEERRRQHLTENWKNLSMAQRGDVRTTLGRLMDYLAAMNEAEGEIARAMLAAWVRAGRPLDEEPYSAGIFTEVVEAARQRGEIPSHIDSVQAGLLIRDAYLGALYRWSRVPAGTSGLRAELNAITRIILEGIGSGELAKP